MCLNDAVAFPDGSAETPELFSLLHIDVEKINRIAAKAAISQIMDNGKSAELSKNELKQIRDVISTTSIWSKLKSSGVFIVRPDSIIVYSV